LLADRYLGVPRIEDQESKIKKRLSPPEALAKISRYCAYQERSHKEVKNKLYEYGLYSSDVEDILTQLITSGFLNEERFAKAFAGGKFRMKKWGRVKIQHELQAQGLTKNCIQRGLNEIDTADYRKTLSVLLRKKMAEVKESNPFKKRDKVARFAIGKGYEPEMVWEYLKDLLPDS
jgi:regulatory protein